MRPKRFKKIIKGPEEQFSLKEIKTINKCYYF